MTVLIQPSFAKGEVGPDIYGRVDTAAYQVALKTAVNVVIRASGGATRRPGTYFIGPCKQHGYSPRLIPFQFKTTDTHILEFGDQYIRVIRNDAYVTEADKVITGISQASQGVVTSVAHGFSNGDQVYLASIAGMTQLNGRWFIVSDVAADTFKIKDQVTSAYISTSGYTAYSSGGAAARVYTISSPYLQADLFQLNFVQSADVMTLVHKNYAPRELSRSGIASWSLATITFAPSIAAPASVTVTPDAAAGKTYSYKVTAVSDATKEESVAATGSTATGATASPSNVITWPAVTGAASYNVYRLGAGQYGFIGSATALTFHDVNISPDETDTPPDAYDPFSGAGNYPSAVTYYEQRRVFGGTTNKPDTNYFSQVGAYSNFSKSEPLRDSDAITATLSARQVNEVREYVPGNDLLVFTSGSEWRQNSGSDSAFAASTLRQKPQSNWGTTFQRPIVIGTTSLFVQENSNRVRSFGFSLQLDGYTGTDLNLLASHMFESAPIVDWDMAKYPDNIIHAVRSDGYVCSLTFQQEQEVIAWARWKTAGKFEAVACLPRATGELFDRTYFVVKRIVNGNVVRYVERLKPQVIDQVEDCFFVDCGLSLDNPITISGVTSADPCVVTAIAHGLSNGDTVDITDIVWVADEDDAGGESQPDQLNHRRFLVANKATDTFELNDLNGNPVDASEFNAYVEGGKVRKAVQSISNMHHLEGKTLAALCDGNVITGLVPSNGVVTLPRKFSRVHLGLGYVSDIETLDKEVSPQQTIQGRTKSIGRLSIRFQKSRGCFYGPTFDEKDLVELKQREDENYDEPTRLDSSVRTVVCPPAWNKHGRVCVRQSKPLPMTVLGIIPDYTLEDYDKKGD